MNNTEKLMNNTEQLMNKKMQRLHLEIAPGMEMFYTRYISWANSVQ